MIADVSIIILAVRDIVEHVRMIDGAERLPKVRGTVASNE